MRLMQVVADDTMMVPGYEHHTLMCPTCGEVERRLTFRSQNIPRRSPLDPVPTVLPASTRKDERVNTRSVWTRALASLRSRRSDKL
jgi:hypothetical protein